MRAQYTRNSYVLTVEYEMEDGSEAPATHTQTIAFGQNYSVSSPNVAGYTPDKLTVSGTIQEKNVLVKVLYTANKDTAYIVNHYTENLDGDWTLADTDNLTGTTNEIATADLKSYTGFSAPTLAPSTVIAGDGTAVIRVEYPRNSYTISFDSAGGSAVDAITAKYGASITTPLAPIKTGYAFEGWY